MLRIISVSPSKLKKLLCSIAVSSTCGLCSEVFKTLSTYLRPHLPSLRPFIENLNIIVESPSSNKNKEKRNFEYVDPWLPHTPHPLLCSTPHHLNQGQFHSLILLTTSPCLAICFQLFCWQLQLLLPLRPTFMLVKALPWS